MLKNNEQLTEALNETVYDSREFIKISLDNMMYYKGGLADIF